MKCNDVKKWNKSFSIKLKDAKQYILRYILNILEWQPDGVGKYTNDEAKSSILQEEKWTGGKQSWTKVWSLQASVSSTVNWKLLYS